MDSTHMVPSSSRFTTLARCGAAGLALVALLAGHIATPGSALAGGCGSCDDDFDGLTNSEEIGFGTDLSNPDTDFDGASDLDEIVFLYTNPLVPDQGPVATCRTTPATTTTAMASAPTTSRPTAPMSSLPTPTATASTTVTKSSTTAHLRCTPTVTVTATATATNSPSATIP